MQLRRDPQTGPFFGLSLLIMGLAVPLFILNGGSQSLAGCDESYYAQMARELLTSGSWLIPEFLGEPFFEKPPLLQWLVALSFRLYDINEWSARLPGILCGLGSIPLIGWIGRQCLPTRAAVIGMAVLPLSYLWIQEGRLVGQDVPLTFLELLGIAALIGGMRGSPFWFGVTGLALGLALLMKSAMVLLAGAALIPYLVAQAVISWHNHRIPWFLSWQFWVGIGSGIGLFGLWLGLASRMYGSQVWQGLIGKVDQLGSTSFHTDITWVYYLWHIPAHGFPWSVLGIWGGIFLIRQQPWRSLLIWSFPLMLLLLLQVYPTRTHYYTVQLYPWLALLAGVTLDQAMQLWQSSRSGQLWNPVGRGSMPQFSMHLRQAFPLALWISWALALVGWLILGLAGAVVLGVEGLEILQPHIAALIMVGMLYTILPLIWLGRRMVQSSETVWLLTLLMASGVVMVSAITRPDFGNFNPALAQFAQQEWIDVLPLETSVDIGRSGLADVCEAQAHAFYTPNPGQWIHDEDLRSGRFGSHIWISPVQWQEYGSQLPNLELLAEVEGWRLMEKVSGAAGGFDLPLEQSPEG